MKERPKRAGIESSQTIASVTVFSDHNCETRHIKSITGHKSDQAVESYNELPSMEQQQNLDAKKTTGVDGIPGSKNSEIMCPGVIDAPVQAAQPVV